MTDERTGMENKTATDVRVTEVEPAIRKRTAAEMELNKLLNAKADALHSGNARDLLDATNGLLEAGPKVVQACADVENALDNYKQQFESEFSRDWTKTRETIAPIRARLNTLRAEVEELETREAIELEKAAPAIERIESRKRERQAWVQEQKAVGGDLIRRLHA